MNDIRKETDHCTRSCNYLHRYIFVIGIRLIVMYIEDHQGRIVISLALIEKWHSCNGHADFNQCYEHLSSNLRRPYTECF